jgi:outer membrane protein TolC
VILARTGVRRAAVAGLALAGLGACVRYVPRPLDPVPHVAAYRARRLDDAALLAWVGRFGPRPEPTRWSARQLALAALAGRADLVRLRAEWRAAGEGERAAGVRPPPGAQADLERAVSGSDGASPWVVALGAMLTVELGGKRGARLAQARARTAMAEADLRAAAWSTVMGVRDAATTVAGLEQDATQARAAVAGLMRVDSLERARYDEGSLPASELARTRADVQDAVVQASAAESAALEARAALAGSMALPARALDSVQVDGRGGECARVDAPTPDGLAALALGQRAEIGRALADYAAAEADLRLEVARQYPDLELGPGFIWDQGVHRWTLGLAVPNLLGFRKRASIDQAARLREAAAARVMEVQDDILAELDQAVARCRGARREREAARSQLDAAERAAALARAAYDRGETSRLEPALAELALVRAARAHGAAEARLARADAALDRALGDWPGNPAQRWPDPREPSLAEKGLP